MSSLKDNPASRTWMGRPVTKEWRKTSDIFKNISVLNMQHRIQHYPSLLLFPT
jgi:hypothetical protein